MSYYKRGVMSIRKEMTMAFIVLSVGLNFFASFFLITLVRGFYWAEKGYTTQKQIMDSIKIISDRLPALGLISIGVAIGIIFMTIWICAGFDNGKR